MLVKFIALRDKEFLSHSGNAGGSSLFVILHPEEIYKNLENI
jgi:hypothetical protein